MFVLASMSLAILIIPHIIYTIMGRQNHQTMETYITTTIYGWCLLTPLILKLWVFP